MKEIDVRGLSCPVPVMKTKKAMDADAKDTLAVLLDSNTALENVTRLAKGRGYTVREEKTGDECRLVLLPPEK